jgi:hypothetical protein
MNEDRLDALIDARQQRSALWAAACAGELTTNQLYDRLLNLRETWGDALYERPSRR